MDKIEIICYHGTDREIAKKIVEDKFICKPNNQHWLGNGIYFYQDEALAKWWTTKPSKKFGSDISDPVLLKCKIGIDRERVLDIRTFDGYTKYIKEFDDFYKIAYEYRIAEGKMFSYDKLRCIFFNTIFKTGKYDLFIAPFVADKQPYLPKSRDEIFIRNMHILFTEGQLCLSEKCQYLIETKEIIEICERR